MIAVSKGSTPIDISEIAVTAEPHEEDDLELLFWKFFTSPAYFSREGLSKMRKSLIILIAMAAGLSSLSIYRNPSTDLLDEHDYDRMRIDLSRGPALSGPLVNGTVSWASYNQWLCFPTQNIDIACAEDLYGEKVTNPPVLHVMEGSHYFEFGMDPEPAPDCDKITARWNALLKDEGAFCVYAAPLQELDISAYDTHAEAGSLWIVNQLKTAKGYWHFESDENWLRQDDDDSTEGDSETVSTDPEN